MHKQVIAFRLTSRMLAPMAVVRPGRAGEISEGTGWRSRSGRLPHPRGKVDSMETLTERDWCPASDVRRPSCLVDEQSRRGWCHCCKQQVPVYCDEGHWVYNWHALRSETRPAVEVLPPLR